MSFREDFDIGLEILKINVDECTRVPRMGHAITARNIAVHSQNIADLIRQIPYLNNDRHVIEAMQVMTKGMRALLLHNPVLAEEVSDIIANLQIGQKYAKEIEI